MQDNAFWNYKITAISVLHQASPISHFAPSFVLIKCHPDLSVHKNQQKAFPFLLKDWLQEAWDHNEKEELPVLKTHQVC